MNQRNKFITFLAALIPGLGQMYLGLIKKGVQIFVLYLLVHPIFSIIGLGSIGSLIKLVIWCYAFFDTFDTARRLDRGEHINDTDFIFNKFSNGNQGGDKGFGFHGFSFNSNLWIACGWTLVIVGILAIINLMFGTNELYNLIRSYVSTYFLPVALVVAGLYLLFRYKR